MSTPTWSPVKVSGGGAPAGAPGGPPGSGPTTSSRGLSGWASKNKVALGAGAVGLVVVLALATRNKGSDTATAAGATVSGTTAGQNTGAYDSSASDVYNAIQPEVAGLRGILEQFLATNTVPVPTTPTTGTGTGTDVTTPPVTTTPTPSTVPIGTGTYTAEQVTNIFKSPVGSALAQQGYLPPADSGATNSQAQADYGKNYEKQWEAMYGLKK